MGKSTSLQYLAFIVNKSLRETPTEGDTTKRPGCGGPLVETCTDVETVPALPWVVVYVKAKTKVYCESPVREFLARAIFVKDLRSVLEHWIWN
jgi:hypothetical protein